jgi:hypothetical protein
MLITKELLLLIVITLNIFVWFFGNSFLNLFKHVENSPWERMPSQKEKWDFINYPKFIWYPRIVMFITLVVVIWFFVLGHNF